MTFPASESLNPNIWPAIQWLQLAGGIRDRTRQLGVDIDAGTATTATMSKWLDDVADRVQPIADIGAMSGMQATLRFLVDDGKLAITDESNAMLTALDVARGAAKGIVPFLAPTFDDASGRIKDDASLASIVPDETLSAFRATLDVLVATIAPGAK